MAKSVDQPQSTIDKSGDQYAAYDEDDGSDGDLLYSTAQTPNPECPDDTPDGDPDYYWDFGPLDGLDNGDGTATIYTDTEGSYQVTVYCEQDFTASDGSDYTEDIQTSD